MILPVLALPGAAVFAAEGQWGVATLVGLAEALLIVFVVSLWRSSRVRRGLVYDRAARQCVILTSRGKRPPVEEARSDQCSFLIHEVRLAINHTRTGKPTNFWNGFAAVVHVGPSRFVLACDKEVDVLREYSQSLPDWMPVLNEADGPPIEADAHRRIL